MESEQHRADADVRALAAVLAKLYDGYCAWQDEPEEQESVRLRSLETGLATLADNLISEAEMATTRPTPKRVERAFLRARAFVDTMKLQEASYTASCAAHFGDRPWCSKHYVARSDVPKGISFKGMVNALLPRVDVTLYQITKTIQYVAPQRSSAIAKMISESCDTIINTYLLEMASGDKYVYLPAIFATERNRVTAAALTLENVCSPSRLRVPGRPHAELRHTRPA